MSHQDDTATLIYGCLDRRDIDIGVARAGHHDWLRRDATGENDCSPDYHSQPAI
jgi:hypothetical protein